MTYKLEFKKSALKEWKKLGATLQSQFKKKLIERLESPHVRAYFHRSRSLNNIDADHRITSIAITQ